MIAYHLHLIVFGAILHLVSRELVQQKLMSSNVVPAPTHWLIECVHRYSETKKY